MKSQENGLENDIASLEKRLDEDNLSEKKIIKYWTSWPLQREELSSHKTKGAIIQSKARWYHEGEKYVIFPKS